RSPGGPVHWRGERLWRGSRALQQGRPESWGPRGQRGHPLRRPQHRPADASSPETRFLTTAGVSGLTPPPLQDNLIYNVNNAFGHPTCGFGEDAVVLPPTQ